MGGEIAVEVEVVVASRVADAVVVAIGTEMGVADAEAVAPMEGVAEAVTGGESRTSREAIVELGCHVTARSDRTAYPRPLSIVNELTGMPGI